MRACTPFCRVAALAGSLWTATHAISLQGRADDEISDPFEIYDGQTLLHVSACEAGEVEMISVGFSNSRCHILSEPGELTLPLDGGCVEGVALCPQDSLFSHQRSQVIANGTAGEYLRRRSSSMIRPWPRASVEMRREDTFFEAFRSYDDILARLDELVTLANGTAELLQLSPSTFEGRAIRAVRLRGPGWKPGHPRALFTYLLHAREWIAGMAGVYAVEQIIAQARADASFLQNLEVIFVPIGNPDGFVYSSQRARFWRKNRRPNFMEGCVGVDLNRNFDFMWQEVGHGRLNTKAVQACEEIYSGPAPASEPETQALQNLVLEAPLSVSIDFHSCGGYILGPWSYTREIHPRLSEIDSLGTALKSSIEADSGSHYRFCTGNSCLYTVSGDLADFSTNTGALGFTIEMRPTVQRTVAMYDFAPPPQQILPNARENFQAVLTALAFARARSGMMDEWGVS